MGKQNWDVLWSICVGFCILRSLFSI
jgi:hypothetical protein